jgi:hypothetical protein
MYVVLVKRKCCVMVVLGWCKRTCRVVVVLVR